MVWHEILEHMRLHERLGSNDSRLCLLVHAYVLFDVSRQVLQVAPF